MSRRDEGLWDDVADAVIDYIKLKADDRDLKGSLIGDLRKEYLKAMSDDRWRSREFNNLVDATMSALREVEHHYAREGDKKLDVINMAARMIVDGHFAVQVLDSEAARELTDRVYDALGDAKAEAIRLTRSSRDDDRDDRDDRNPYDDRDDRRERGRSRNRSSGGGRNGRETADDGWDVLSDIGNDDRKEKRHHDDVDDDDRDDRRYEPEPVKAKEVPRVEVPAPVDDYVDGPDWSLANPFDDYIDRGEHFRAAHLSDWKLTPDVDLPHPEDVRLSTIPTLYNINTHIKYYVMDADNCVREEFEPVTDENRHLNHALREDTRVEEVSRPRSARVNLNRNDDDLRPYEEPRQAGMNLAQQLEQIDVTTMKMDDVGMGDSLNGLVFSGQMELLAGGGVPRVDLFFQRTPLVVRNKVQLELIDQVNDTTTLTAAADTLVKLRDQFEKPIWEVLNARFKENILRISRFQFQFNGVAKFNFSTQYGRFLQAFREARGNEETSLFSRRSSHVTSTSCAHMLLDDLKSGNADDLIKGRDVDALLFMDFFALISTNATIDELGIGTVLNNNPTGISVESTNNAALFGQLRRIFERLDQEVPPQTRGRLIIATADNRLLEVHPYFGEHKAYILSAVVQ